MKVIFLAAVPPRKPGDVANVASGYALNFLFPRKLAQPATPEAEKAAQQRLAKQVSDQTKTKAEIGVAFAALQGAQVKCPAKAAPSGKLYAALGPKAIAACIQEAHQIALSPNLVRQLPLLKQAGSHPVTLQHGGQQVTFTVTV